MLVAAIHADAVGLSAAFAAGFVSFVSPCVWPLVPAYLSYVSGVAFADLADDTRRVVLATACFVLGFGTIFTLIGVGVGVAGSQLTGHRHTLDLIGGIVVVAMGLALVFSPAFLQREHRLRLPHRPGLGGALLAGVAFAVGWTPCIGPTLGAIADFAAQTGHAGEGAALLAAYSLGLGVPFLLSGLFFTRALGAVSVVRRHTPVLMRVAGALLVVAGVLLATGALTSISQQLSTV